MSTAAGTFSAVGNSNTLLIAKDNSFSYSLTTASLTGSVVLERAIGGGWETVLTFTGATSGTYMNDTGMDQRYRWRCVAIGEGETVDYTLADVSDTVNDWYDSDGNLLMRLSQGGMTFTHVIVGPGMTFNGATGANIVTVPTNLADALSIVDSAGDLVVITTTTGSQLITVTPAVTLTNGVATNTIAERTAASGVTIDGVLLKDYTVTSGLNGASGVAGAFVIRDGANPGSTTTLDFTDLTKLDAITNGTAAANKALVLGASKEIGTITTLGATNVDVGASGTAGSLDVYPATASKGKLAVAVTDQTGDTTVTLQVDAMGQATAVHLPDPGAAASYLVQSTAQITLAEADVLDGATAGTIVANKAVVASADKDVADFRNVGASGALTLKGGAAAAAVVARFGASATEGWEIKVIDEDVTLTNAVAEDLTEDIPTGAVILSVQANLETLIAGDTTGDDGLTKVGIGISSDPDKYGKTAALTQNSKVDTIPDWAVLASPEDIQVYAVDNSGTAVTEKFVAAGVVRVRIVYAVCNSLDDAA